MPTVPKSPATAARSPSSVTAAARSTPSAAATVSAVKSFVSSAPSAEPKVVLLSDWWLIKVETSSGEGRLGISGLTNIGHHAARLFRSNPITKRYDAYTLGTADEIIIRIQGTVNEVHMLQNGFPPEVCRYFITGFPYNWDSYVDEFFSGNYLLKDSLAEKHESSTANSDEYFPVGKIANLLKSFFTRGNDLLQHDSSLVHDTRRDAAHAEVQLGKRAMHDKETLRKDLSESEATASSLRHVQLKDGNTFEALVSCDVGRVNSCVSKEANLTEEPLIGKGVPGTDTALSENTYKHIDATADVGGTTLPESISGFHGGISSTSVKLGNLLSSIEGVSTSEDLRFKSSGVITRSMFKRQDRTEELKVQETGIFKDSHAETHPTKESANFPTVIGTGEVTTFHLKWKKPEKLYTENPIRGITLVSSVSKNVNKATIEPRDNICLEPPHQRSTGKGKQFASDNIDSSLVIAEENPESVGLCMDIRTNGVLQGECKGEKGGKSSSLLSHASGKDGVNLLEKNFATRNSLQVAPESFITEEGAHPFEFTTEGCENRLPAKANNADDAGHMLEFSGKLGKDFATGVSKSFGVTTMSSSVNLSKRSHDGNLVTTGKVMQGLASVLEGQTHLNILTKVKNKDGQKKHKKFQSKKHTPTSGRKEPNVLKRPLDKFSDTEPTSTPEVVRLVDQNRSLKCSVEFATTPGVSIRVDSRKDDNSQNNVKKMNIRPRSSSMLHKNKPKSTPVKKIRGSTYKNLCDSQRTWDKANQLPIASPELLNLKRSRSGRLLVPALDRGSQHLVYDMDGSITGIAGMDLLKSPGIAGQDVLKSTNPGTKSETLKRKK